MEPKDSLFELIGYRVFSSRNGTGEHQSEATVKLKVKGEVKHEASNGDGPVNALDLATRKILVLAYPEVEKITSLDFWSRDVDIQSGAAALVEVLIILSDGKTEWMARAKTKDIIEATWIALEECYKRALSSLTEKSH
jgi:2-isopropylmalate synthase